MIFEKAIHIKELAERLGAELKGNADLIITGMNEINKVQSGQLIFVDHPKYYEKVLNSKASAIIIDRHDVNVPTGKALLIHETPFLAYNRLAKELRPTESFHQKIASDVQVGEDTIIEKGAFIGSHCTIGARCHIHAGSYIGHYTHIGDDVNIQPLATIGSDAFYFNKNSEAYIPWHSIGRVIIHDRVFIGSGSTINRGVSGDTIVGEGSKIDCQVQIGHGVVIGNNCLIAAQAGIGGKTILEDNVTLYGQVGVAQRIRIGANAIILGKSGVTKSLPGGKTYFGYPAAEVGEKYKELAALRMLPNFMTKHQ